MQSDNLLEVSIRRGDNVSGELVTYQVPNLENQTILDVVSWVQLNAEPGLAYRYACRVGMCGSCAMMVNGEPMWTCRTHVKKMAKNNRLKIEPLRNLKIIKDLACDMSEFFDKWQRAKGVFLSSTTREEPIAKLSPADTKRAAANDAIECINCAVCYAACDVVRDNDAYFGPAALNRAWALVNDVRDNASDVRLAVISGTSGCFNCHSQQGCATYCPNELNPTRSIAGLKRHIMGFKLKNFGARENQA